MAPQPSSIPDYSALIDDPMTREYLASKVHTQAPQVTAEGPGIEGMMNAFNLITGVPKMEPIVPEVAPTADTAPAPEPEVEGTPSKETPGGSLGSMLGPGITGFILGQSGGTPPAVPIVHSPFFPGGAATVNAPAATPATPVAGSGPLAAAIAAAYAGYRGLRTGWGNYQQGHGRQQQGVLEMANPVPVGANRILGDNSPISSRDMAHIAGITNPLTQPLVAADMLGINLWSGKGKDQVARDQIRARMKDAGLVNDNWQIKLANGDLYDIGADGNSYAFNVQNANNQDVSRIVGLANVLGDIVAGEPGQRAQDFAGYFTNAAQSNANNYDDMSRNVYSLMSQFADKLKFTPKDVRDMYQKWHADGKLSDADYASRMLALESMINGKDPQFTSSQPLTPGQAQEGGFNPNKYLTSSQPQIQPKQQPVQTPAQQPQPRSLLIQQPQQQQTPQQRQQQVQTNLRRGALIRNYITNSGAPANATGRTSRLLFTQRG